MAGPPGKIQHMGPGNQEELRKTCTRSLALFCVQLCLIGVMVITSLTVLALEICKPEDRTYWASLLSASVGYIMPTPKLKRIKRGEVSNEDHNSSASN